MCQSLSRSRWREGVSRPFLKPLSVREMRGAEGGRAVKGRGETRGNRCSWRRAGARTGPGGQRSSAGVQAT